MKKYLYEDALKVANEIKGWLVPYCTKITIAGSLRRKKAEVGDIEILCIPEPFGGYSEPKMERIHHLLRLAPTGGFIDWADDEVDMRVQSLIGIKVLSFRLNSKGSRVYGKLNKLLVHCASKIPLDVFSVPEDAWAIGLLIRTGSKSFNIKLCMQAKKLGFHIKPYKGIIDQQGNLLKPKTEEEIFKILELDYVSPEGRN